MRSRWSLGALVIAGLVPLVAAAGEPPLERRPAPPRDEGAWEARLLADLEILRDLELLRQMDILRKMDEVRSGPPPRDARTEGRGKP